MTCLRELLLYIVYKKEIHIVQACASIVLSNDQKVHIQICDKKGKLTSSITCEIDNVFTTRKEAEQKLKELNK